MTIEGNRLRIKIAKVPCPYGNVRSYMVCPMCGHNANVLRKIPVAPYLGCKRDLVKLYGARYRSQVARYRLPAVSDDELTALVQKTDQR